MGLMQSLAALTIALLPDASPYLVCGMGTAIYFAQAFMDVVVDGLMVCQQRLDPQTGSENLQAYSWICYSVGGTLFGITGGFLLDSLSPSFVFYITALIGLCITVNGFMTSPKLEASSQAIINMGFCDRTKMNFREIY